MNHQQRWDLILTPEINNDLSHLRNSRTKAIKKRACFGRLNERLELGLTASKNATCDAKSLILQIAVIQAEVFSEHAVLRGNRRDARNIVRYWLSVLRRIDWNAMRSAKSIEDHPELAFKLGNVQLASTSDKDLDALLIAYVRNTPIAAITARIKPDGLFAPGKPAIVYTNPAVFPDPFNQESSRIRLGDVASVAEARRKYPLDESAWSAYFASAKNFLAAAIMHDRATEDEAEPADRLGNITWRIVPGTELTGPEAAITRFYESLIPERVPLPTLFRDALELCAVDQRESLKKPLVHVDTTRTDGARDGRSLDRSQREAASRALAAYHAQKPFVVNGPPGTGKTTFLRSVIASAWIEPLLEENWKTASPPVIVACGATKTAILNVRGTFEKAARPNGIPGIDQSFFAELNSYGWYSTSRSTFRKSAPGSKVPGPSMQLGMQWIPEGPGMGYQLLARNAGPLSELEYSGTRALDGFEAMYLTSCSELFGTVDSIDRALDVLHGAMLQLIDQRNVAQIQFDATANFEESLAKIDLGRLTPLVAPWTHLADRELKRLSSKNAASEVSSEERFLAYIELGIGVPLFHLGARLWEGRWLLSRREIAMEPTPLRSDILRSWCMLSPLIVSTLHSLPNLFDERGKFALAEADLIIVDEAGQAPSYLTAPAFAFAKSVILVGDSEQLAPIPKIEPSEEPLFEVAFFGDHGNLAQPLCFCASSALDIGHCITPGQSLMPPGASLMINYRSVPTIMDFCNKLSYEGRLRINRENTSSSPWPAMSFVDSRALPSLRGLQPGPSAAEGSASNELELEAIVTWLLEERATIEAAYDGKGIQDVVAVITPFRRQAERLREEIAKRLKVRVLDEVQKASSDDDDAELDDDEPEHVTTAEEMVVGTVHALQGKERPIVMFSLCGDKTVGTRLIENDSVMKRLLNVGVSRARDSFVFVGDLEYATVGATPLRELSTYLRTYGRRLFPHDVVVIEAPGKQEIFQQSLGLRSLVIASGGQVADLPEPAVAIANWSIDDFTMKEGAWSRLREMRNALGRFPSLYIATDNDREGEVIGYWIARYLARYFPDPPLRMRVDALTREALRAAKETAQPGFDAGRIRAGITRRMIDAYLARHYARFLNDFGEIAISRIDAALLMEIDDRLSRQQQFHVQVTANEATGLVVDSATSVASPTYFENGRASEVANALHGASSSTLQELEVMRRDSAPGNSTGSILISATRQLGLDPARTSQLLQALYIGDPKEIA